MLKTETEKFKFNFTETVELDNLLQCKSRDIAWMVSCASIDTTTMWHGWDAQITEDKLPQQTITCMDLIEHSTTRIDVVQKTMDMALHVLKECYEDYMSVTYDLDIANPAVNKGTGI